MTWFYGSFHANINLKTDKKRFWQAKVPLSTLLLAAKGEKLLGPHGYLEVGKYRPSMMNRLRGITTKLNDQIKSFFKIITTKLLNY